MEEYIPQKSLRQQLEELTGIKDDYIRIHVCGCNNIHTVFNLILDLCCYEPYYLNHFYSINSPTKEEIEMFLLLHPDKCCPPFEVVEVTRVTENPAFKLSVL